LPASRGIFLETIEQIKAGPTFEQRYFEAHRRTKLAPEIGNLAVHAVLEKGLEKRQYEEITSGLAEALPGIVSTDYPFELKEGKLVASDDEAIEELLANALRKDIKTASDDEFYARFLPQRSRHELDEFREQQAMANEQADFNTIVTFSPYSQEYDTPQTRLKLKRAAQEPDWQRGMIRVSHWNGRQLHVFTRSVDNSSVSILRETAKRQLGYEFEAEDSTAMLGERIHLNIAGESWHGLADSLVKHADDILADQRGGKWIQGRPAGEAIDTQKYVQSRQEIVQALLGKGQWLAERCEDFESYKQAFDKEIYNHIALLKFPGRVEAGAILIDIAAASSAAGAMARARGEVYNMCGHVIAADSTIAQVAEKTGFESLRRLAGQELRCINPRCRKKVIVPVKDLDAGVLSCNKCGLVLNVCTGEADFDKNKINSPKNNSKKPEAKPETDWQRIKREDRAKRQAEKLAQQAA